MELLLARSLAGHDKDEIYVITGGEGDMALLSNGANRPLAHPKKKRYKHLQLIKRLPDEVRAEADGELDDIRIKRILKVYSVSLNKE